MSVVVPLPEGVMPPEYSTGDSGAILAIPPDRGAARDALKPL